MIIGTPLNENLVPNYKIVVSAINDIADFHNDKQLVILRGVFLEDLNHF